MKKLFNFASLFKHPKMNEKIKVTFNLINGEVNSASFVAPDGVHHCTADIRKNYVSGANISLMYSGKTESDVPDSLQDAVNDLRGYSLFSSVELDCEIIDPYYHSFGCIHGINVQHPEIAKLKF